MYLNDGRIVALVDQLLGNTAHQHPASEKDDKSVQSAKVGHDAGGGLQITHHHTVCQIGQR